MPATCACQPREVPGWDGQAENDDPLAPTDRHANGRSGGGEEDIHGPSEVTQPTVGTRLDYHLHLASFLTRACWQLTTLTRSATLNQ
jgi:hypothetical protein